MEILFCIIFFWACYPVFVKIAGHFSLDETKETFQLSCQCDALFSLFICCSVRYGSVFSV